MEANPLVSIIMITYNQENYIEKAISGIVEQSYQNYELIISDDCSSDNTRNICKKYASQNFRINYIQQDKNIGAVGNFFLTVLKAKGKYIALCEGDDYWIDSNKLKKQVCFLENNHEFVTCFHPVNILENNILLPCDIKYDKNIYNILDLAKGNFIHTVSAMFRRIDFEIYNVNFNKLHVGDYILHMLSAQYGNLYLMNETMAVYRIHNHGVWSRKSEIFQYEKISEYLEILIKFNFEYKVYKILKKRLSGIYQALYSNTHKYRYLVKLFKINPLLGIKILLK